MRIKEIVILTLGSLGFLSQIIIQFLGQDPNYIVMGGALALLGVAPLLRLDEHNHNHSSQGKEEQP